MKIYDKAFEEHPVAVGKAISKMERCVVKSYHHHAGLEVVHHYERSRARFHGEQSTTHEARVPYTSQVCRASEQAGVSPLVPFSISIACKMCFIYEPWGGGRRGCAHERVVLYFSGVA